MATKRQKLTKKEIFLAIDQITDKTAYRFAQKGPGGRASAHEILGILEDELQEFRDEIHAKSDANLKVQELLDIAVECVFGIASIQSGSIDW